MTISFTGISPWQVQMMFGACPYDEIHQTHFKSFAYSAHGKI